MSNKAYDTLKMIALLVLPIGTFIVSLCNIWGIPNAEQIQATVAALDIFAGALVTIAKIQYDRRQQS